MLEKGLVDEVERLEGHGLHQGSSVHAGPGLQRDPGLPFRRRLSLEEAVYIIKRDTRHFAKRQLTWFQRERDVTWVDTGTVFIMTGIRSWIG